MGGPGGYIMTPALVQNFIYKYKLFDGGGPRQKVKETILVSPLLFPF